MKISSEKNRIRSSSERGNRAAGYIQFLLRSLSLWLLGGFA